MNNLNFIGNIVFSEFLKDVPWWGYVAAVVWWGLGVLVIVRSYSNSGIGSAIFTGLFFVVTLGIFGPLTSFFARFVTRHLKEIFEPLTKPFSK